jgi:hypothetical protein
MRRVTGGARAFAYDATVDDDATVGEPECAPVP